MVVSSDEPVDPGLMPDARWIPERHRDYSAPVVLDEDTSASNDQVEGDPGGKRECDDVHRSLVTEISLHRATGLRP